MDRSRMGARREFGLCASAAKRTRADDGVPRGRATPCVADDVAEWCVTWSATCRTPHNVDRLVVRQLAQAAQHKVHRVAT